MKNYYLQSELQEERSFTERLTDGIGRMLDFLKNTCRSVCVLCLKK